MEPNIFGNPNIPPNTNSHTNIGTQGYSEYQIYSGQIHSNPNHTEFLFALQPLVTTAVQGLNTQVSMDLILQIIKFPFMHVGLMQRFQPIYKNHVVRSHQQKLQLLYFYYPFEQTEPSYQHRTKIINYRKHYSAEDQTTQVPMNIDSKMTMCHKKCTYFQVTEVVFSVMLFTFFSYPTTIYFLLESNYRTNAKLQQISPPALASGLLAEYTSNLCLWSVTVIICKLSGHRVFLDIINLLIYFQELECFLCFRSY